MSSFAISTAHYTADLPSLRAVRDVVFVQEQCVPLDIELDALDPLCTHVLARDPAGLPIGTGRLAPDGKIGRMAVVRDWRGRGVGLALLRALIAQAQEGGLRQVHLHAQVDAEGFYAAEGFLPVGERFEEAGIVHRAMQRALDGPSAVENAAQGRAATIAVLASARRAVFIYSRDMDPGLLDHPDVLAAFRRLAVRGAEIRLLLQDAAAPQRAHAPLIALAQRLTTAFSIRVIEEPVDLNYPAAFLGSDTGGWYFRPLGHRFEGEADRDGPARMRQLRTVFEGAWERARPATELRTLGL